MDGPAPHQRSSTIISTRSRDPSTSALPSARTSMRVDSTPASTRRDRTARARDNERRRLRLCSASVPGAYAFRRRRRKGSSLSPCRQGLQRLRDIIQRFGGVGREGNGQPLSLGRGRLDALPDRWRRHLRQVSLPAHRLPGSVGPAWPPAAVRLSPRLRQSRRAPSRVAADRAGEAAAAPTPDRPASGRTVRAAWCHRSAVSREPDPAARKP